MGLWTALGSPEGGSPESGHRDRDSPRLTMQLFELGWWKVPDRLHQSTVAEPVHPAGVSISTATMLFHGLNCSITSVLYSPMMLSTSALSYEFLTLPTEGWMPTSANRSVYQIDRYCTPRSLWCTRSSVSQRAYRACSSASSARSLRSERDTRQPTIRLEKASMTNAA